MSEGILTVLKFCLLALLYLFLARVVWVVGRELRGSPAPAPPAGAAPTGRAARGRAWRLVVVAPETERREFEVAGELTIGRAGGCAVPLPHDTFASSVHARVFDRDGTLWVEDLGSTNGTLLNGELVSAGPQQLGKGDVLQVGETLLEATR